MEFDSDLEETEKQHGTQMDFYVTDIEKEKTIEEPTSPCMMKLINEQRKDPVKPNLWSSMNTIQLKIFIDEIPENGEILLFSSFNPSFWKTQPKLQQLIVSEPGEKMFKSTNEIWIITRCKGTCIKGGDSPGPAQFRMRY